MNEKKLPVVVSYGGGTNSTAMLIGAHMNGITPALIMFADTGNEKPGTYEHLGRVQDWCRSVGFPEIVIVRNELPQGIKDGSLYGECLRLGTLPSKTFGYSTCSMKWKVEPQTRYLRQWMEATETKKNRTLDWLRCRRNPSIAKADSRARVGN